LSIPTLSRSHVRNHHTKESVLSGNNRPRLITGDWAGRSGLPE
jgi:hypothetical protein